MIQRVFGEWGPERLPGGQPRLLIEDDDPALVVSGFRLFRDAGFAVAHCSGPGDTLADCPLLRGRPCAFVEGADVVLHRLGGLPAIPAGIRRLHRRAALVVAEHGSRAPWCLGGAAEPGALAPTAPVGAQVRAVRRALSDRRRESEVPLGPA